MMPTFVYGSTITVVHREVSGRDERGNDVYSEATAQISNCAVYPATSRENLAFADQLMNSIDIFVPAGTDVEFIDAVIVDGIKYEVDGKPDTWASPFTSNTAPTRIRATRVEGASP